MDELILAFLAEMEYMFERKIENSKSGRFGLVDREGDSKFQLSIGKKY